MKQQNGHRGRDSRSQVARIAQEVSGMVLSQAYVVAKSAGCVLKVNKLDGVPWRSDLAPGAETISVDVVGGIVMKGWAS
jgi:hypothetical protein